MPQNIETRKASIQQAGDDGMQQCGITLEEGVTHVIIVPCTRLKEYLEEESTHSVSSLCHMIPCADHVTHPTEVAVDQTENKSQQA